MNGNPAFCCWITDELQMTGRVRNKSITDMGWSEVRSLQALVYPGMWAAGYTDKHVATFYETLSIWKPAFIGFVSINIKKCPFLNSHTLLYAQCKCSFYCFWPQRQVIQQNSSSLQSVAQDNYGGTKISPEPENRQNERTFGKSKNPAVQCSVQVPDSLPLHTTKAYGGA